MWEWLSYLVYRKRHIEVEFDPISGTVRSTEPLPAGATLSIGVLYTDEGQPVSIGTVTQKELRIIPALIRRLWMARPGAQVPGFSGSVGEDEPQPLCGEKITLPSPNGLARIIIVIAVVAVASWIFLLFIAS